MASVLMTLQNYFKVMMPAHIPEESKLYEYEVQNFIKQQNHIVAIK